MSRRQSRPARASAVEVRPEVARALRRRGPVVALETSVAVHGLLPPRGVEAIRRCEAAIREAGAVPAAIGVAAGRLVLGLSASELSRLAGMPQKGAAKAGERDLAPLCAAGAWAGTTVSATCAAAAGAGIRFVATGGIGGIHRTPPEVIDVSADLYALARHPVAVVCAGVKAVLDVPRTIEALEALGVPVVGFGTDELPGFYTAATGLRLAHRVDTAEAAAHLLRLRFDEFGQGGVLVVRPPPGGGLPRDAVQKAVDEVIAATWAARARSEATSPGVGTGPQATPAMLRAVDRAMDGQATTVNLDLLEANARLAALIAVAYAGRLA